jgi:enolase
MTPTIAAVEAFEILDSRGRPTLRARVVLDDRRQATASVPSGASTGTNEALELRDGDPERYGGMGVLRAASNVGAVIAPRLLGLDPRGQREIDQLMIDLDGTEDKSNLGANAILAVSMAVARTAALVVGAPLYGYLGGAEAHRLPAPMMNVINGGKHADNALDFQEFMIAPHGAPTFTEALRYGSETFQALRKLLGQRGLSTSVGDEGGFAPHLESNEAACDLIVAAIDLAGYSPGKDISIALDPAASSFSKDGGYVFAGKQGVVSTDELSTLYAQWTERYPIVSIEDGFDELDWSGFAAQTARLGNRIQIVGDDLYVTNPKFIRRGIDEHSTNAVLIKLNQIGTVTETMDAIELCRSAGWRFIVSHRSGETEDTFISDFAVAMNGGQIKTGSLCRSERVAKYNRLIEIERELGPSAVFANPFARH